MKAKQKTCVLCGISIATTREHVPPKGIFLKPLPNNLITVPACYECNNGSSLNDTKFKIYLGLQSAMHSVEGEMLFKDVLITLKRNPLIKQQILKDMVDMPVYTENGIELPGKGVPWDNEVYVKTLKKITRGLYYHHYKQIMASDVNMNDYFFFKRPDLPEDILYGTVIVKNIFEYYYNRIDETNSSMWFYKFYNGNWGAMIVLDKTHQKKSLITKLRKFIRL